MAFKISWTLELFLVLGVVCFFSGGSHSRMSCPQSLKVEKGNNITVSCSHANMTLVSSYWYKGDPSLTSPILRIEEGEPGGKEYSKGHYDITDAGAMIITGATIHHEGVYWFLSYFDDGSFEKHKVNVNVTITPYHVCPVIDMCSSCKVCSKNINKTGSIKCSITNSRPKLTLKWMIKSRKGIEIFTPTLTEERNIFSDSWNTSTQIEYVATSCDQQAILLCLAQDDMDLLMYKNSSININSDNCTADGTDIEDKSLGTTVIVTVVSLSVCLSVALITCFICFIRRKTNNGNDGSKTPGDLELNNSHAKHSVSRQLMTDEARYVITCLKEVYKPYCFFQGLPFENPIPADYLYTGCQCQVTFSSGAKDVVTSDNLLAKEYFINERLVIIIGNRGSGKTTLLTQIVKAWIDEKDNDFVLIFTSLKGATKDTNLTDLMKQNMSAYNMKDIKCLEETIKDHKCLVLLDGLDEVSFDDGSKSGSVDGGDNKLTCSIDANMPHKCLTVGALLNAQYKNNCSNMKVWATTRNEYPIKELGLDRNCKVLLKGFSNEQIQHYIRKTYSYFVHPDRQNACTLHHASDEKLEDCANESTENNHNLSNKKSILEDEKVGLLETSEQHKGPTCSKDSKNNICENVYKFLEKYDIINSFREAPLLFCLIARIYVATFVVEIPFAKKTDTWNLASVTDYMINCLMSKLTRECNPECDQRNISFLEEKALELTFEGSDFHTNTYPITIQDIEEAIDEAIDIGILQERHLAQSIDKKSVKTAYSGNRDILFCCQYFQDYFAACGFVKNPQNFQKLSQNLSKYKEKEFISLVKFLCNLKKSFVEEHCDFLLKSGWFNCVINCLYEVSEGEYEKKIRKLCDKEITIRSFGSHYHESVVTSFFQKCKETNVKLHSVIFLGEFSNIFLKELCFSSIEKVEFAKKHFTAEDFVYILKEMTKNHGKKQLRFVMCDLDDLSEKREEIQNMDFPRPAVYRKQNLSDMVFQQFNFETLQWKVGKVKRLVNDVLS
ncbi:hypothetical protein HOLleu_22605 [Holothuria leucospilota]|uniref:NACHT domain-containing protein n=1 Tax=Holothuria leucospilota TaxID=206669 RepID=A0A9Q1BYT3_HOLLE|nr:hypothetical protein HOLleu_22605 [Holothuria leucospilota]